jgi:predicted esterase
MRSPLSCLLAGVLLLATLTGARGGRAARAAPPPPPPAADPSAAAPALQQQQPPLPPPPTPAIAAPAAGPDAGPDASKAEVRRYRILFQEEIYWYYVFVPRCYRQRPQGPAMLLLHGAGATGQWSIETWKDLADEKGILLVAPTLPLGPVIESQAPTLFRAILAQVKAAWKFDPRRLYLFGHSAGGILAFDAAMLDSDLFAAVFVHAGVITPEYDWILGRATRKTPIALFIGDRDEYFPLAQARRTRDKLLAAGFPLDYVEIPGHDHTYRTVAPRLNRDGWAWLSQYSLPGSG